MRRKLFVLALLGSTVLTPAKADAAPIVGFIAGAFGIGAGAALAGFSAGVTFAAGTIGGFLIKTVVAIGLSALAAKLYSPSIPAPSARMVNYAQPKAYMEHVIGQTRKGGPLGFTGFQNNRRYYVPILAGHEIEEISEHWLDERVVTLDTSTDDNVSNIETAPITGYGRINPLLGAPGQTADAGLMAAFAEITSSHDFAGLAGAVLWAAKPSSEAFSDVYPTSREWAYAPVLKGHNDIYDPRDDSNGYTANAALLIAWWITDYLGREVDWDEVAAEADYCDTLVTNAEAATQPIWELNGTISDEQEFEGQRAQIAAACDAYLYERKDGKAGFKVGRWIEPSLTLTEADFLGVEFTAGQWGAGAVDEVTITYVEPQNAWRETPSGIWVENEIANPIRDEPQLYMINTHNQAARIAKRLAKVKRAEWTLSGTVGPIGYELLEQRFFRATHSEMGIDAYFEIGEISREADGRFNVTANSVLPTDFDFDAVTEEPERPKYDEVESDDPVPDVSDVTAEAIGSNAVEIGWTDAPEAYRQQIRSTLVTEPVSQTHVVPAGQNPYQITGLATGQWYEFQVRNVTTTGRAGAWKPDVPVSVVVADIVDPPAPLVEFTGVALSGAARLSIRSPNEMIYAGAKIYHAFNSTDFDDAALYETVFGAPNTLTVYDTDALASGDNMFWGLSTNSGGVGDTDTINGPVTILI